MVEILAIAEDERTQDNIVYKIVKILYVKDGKTKYDYLEKMNIDCGECVLTSSGYDYCYGDLNMDNVSIETEETESGTSKVYYIAGINEKCMFPKPLKLKYIHDVVSYLQVKYAGCIGDLDLLL